MLKQKAREVQADPKRRRRQILFQCAVAGGFLLVAYLAADTLLSGLLAASICASTFITFLYPSAESSRPRYLIGGYAAAIVCGGLAGRALALLPESGLPLHAICCAAAVFATILLMVFGRIQHPPAAALAITMLETPKPVSLGLYTLGCVIALCLVKRLLYPRLVNL